MAQTPKKNSPSEEGGKQRYGLFGFSASGGMSQAQRKSMARWAGGIVALLAVGVVALLMAGSRSPGLTVTFDSRGGSTVASQQVKYGALAAEPGQTIRPGYVLVGWSTVPDGGPLWDFEADTVTDTLTLYAVWAPEEEE